jgi:transcriptional regulator with XRE-family HTH domain
MRGGARARWTAVIDGDQLRQLRRQHGLSQESLAYQAEISPSTVTRLERQARASCRTLGRLARALGEQPDARACPPSHPC